MVQFLNKSYVNKINSWDSKLFKFQIKSYIIYLELSSTKVDDDHIEHHTGSPVKPSISGANLSKNT